MSILLTEGLLFYLHHNCNNCHNTFILLFSYWNSASKSHISKSWIPFSWELYEFYETASLAEASAQSKSFKFHNHCLWLQYAEKIAVQRQRHSLTVCFWNLIPLAAAEYQYWQILAFYIKFNILPITFSNKVLWNLQASAFYDWDLTEGLFLPEIYDYSSNSQLLRQTQW